MSILTAKCHERKCLFYRGVKQDNEDETTERHYSTAFPDGIPSEIAYGKNLHIKPFPGDNGIQYRDGAYNRFCVNEVDLPGIIIHEDDGTSHPLLD